MSTVAFLSLAACVLFFFLAVKVVRRSGGRMAHRFFALAMAAVGLWAFGYAYLVVEADPDLRWLWYRIGSTGWVAGLVFIFHAMLQQTEAGHPLAGRLRLPLALAVDLAAAVMYARLLTGTLAVTGFVSSPVGTLLERSWQDPWGLVFTIFVLTVNVLVVALMPFGSLRSADRSERRRALTIILSFGSGLLCNLVINNILPLVLRQPLSPLGHLGFVLTAFGLSFSIDRYDLFALTPSFAAEEIISNMSDAVFLCDRDGRILRTNATAVAFLGCAEDELRNRLLVDFTLDSGPLSRIMAELRDRPGQNRSCDVFVASVSGKRVALRASLTSLADREGDTAGFVVVGRDIRDLRRLELAKKRLEQLSKRLSIQAREDSLTGLSNRRRAIEFLEREFQRCRRYGSSLSVVLLDLDWFKRINDSHGHLAGDEVLRCVAGALKAGLRSSDLCGRFGGEEFLLILPETGLDNAVLAAGKMRGRIEELAIMYEGIQLRITASFGVAVADPATATVKNLLAAADTALYGAKEGGRNKVECAVAAGGGKKREEK